MAMSGASTRSIAPAGRVETFVGRATILATGGAGRTYLYSTAPRGDRRRHRDGVAGGARISNMEFMQFHPTCLYNLEVKNFLITEAMRGEGGHLKLPTTGHPLHARFRRRAELAPRDVVARAIDHEIKRLGPRLCPSRHQPSRSGLRARPFPDHPRQAADAGIDITREPIPVVPAQHYTCGGC
jgi:L-aspartate oxidase